jgi:hypothetical protein
MEQYSPSYEGLSVGRLSLIVCKPQENRHVGAGRYVLILNSIVHKGQTIAKYL